MVGVLVRLGRACWAARRAAGLTALNIATAARVSEPTISRFENGERWIDEVEAVVAAYERECGLERDELWRRAVEDVW